jgi:hypothetical protein
VGATGSTSRGRYGGGALYGGKIPVADQEGSRKEPLAALYEN